MSLKFIASYVSHVALHQLLYSIYMYIDINAYVVYMYKLISLQSFNTQLFLQVEIEFERRPVQKQEEKLNEVQKLNVSRDLNSIQKILFNTHKLVFRWKMKSVAEEEKRGN